MMSGLAPVIFQEVGWCLTAICYRSASRQGCDRCALPVGQEGFT